MIVWINGTFGVGKTSAAAELVNLVPRARVCNPERLGWFLQRTGGLLRPGDFHICARGAVGLSGSSPEPPARPRRWWFITAYEAAKTDLASRGFTIDTSTRNADPKTKPGTGERHHRLGLPMC